MRGNNTGRGARQPRARLSRWRAVAVAVVLTLAPVGTIIGAPIVDSASADTVYPTWADVQKAISDAKANQALLAKITGELAALQSAVDSTQADAKAKGEAYGNAQDAADQQEVVVQQIAARIATAQAAATKAKQAADGLLHAFAMTGGGNLTTQFISDPGQASTLLARIGTVAKLSQTSSDVYDYAIQKQNVVTQLGAQAKVAKTELDRRRDVAQAASEAATAAAAAAAAALNAQVQRQAALQAMQTALNTHVVTEQTGYNAGIQAMYGAGSRGKISKTGWALPEVGPITSGFGMRVDPFNGVYGLHTGTDIGAACGTPIYAAHGGTVIYASWYGDLGNFIQIDTGTGGIINGYGHIQNGGTVVQVGQSVGPGQVIAKVGMTGGATGCHLHYMVRINGNLTDPVPFMRSQGAPLGQSS